MWSHLSKKQVDKFFNILCASILMIGIAAVGIPVAMIIDALV